MEAGGEKMRRVLIYVSTSVLITFILMSLMMTLSKTNLTVIARPVSPGNYEINITGDAYGFYTFLEIFNQLSASRLKWSSSLPTYPPGTYMRFGVNVRNIDFSKVNSWTYHLSVDGLEEGLMELGVSMLLFKCRSGEVDLLFSDFSNGQYHTVDITGTLSGDVVFHINVPPTLPEFHYEGSELTVHIHIGSTPI
jgi:hypothetical protein